MNYFLDRSVYDESIRRIEYLFDEFPNVVVGFSGGKDSTVVLHLALEVATRKNRLPLEVLFIDQEGEWDCTIDYVREVMYDPRVKPAWLQVPMILFNATASNGYDQWLHCWHEGERWLRPKDPISKKENIYGTDRFHKLFDNYIEVTYPNEKACIIGGVRTEESPKRRMVLTGGASPTYKWIYWGKKINPSRGHFIFYPIYDWSLTDVWKAIHDNGWHYNRLYDYQYQYGVSPRDMRVSNVHHETAIQNLWYMQEVEPDLWNRITARLDGINTSAQLKDDIMPKTLPWMFTSWEEYREYLLSHLIADPQRRVAFHKQFDNMTYRLCKDNKLFNDAFNKVCCRAILRNDFEGTLMANFRQSPDISALVKYKRGERVFKRGENDASFKYIDYELNNK